jgi:hypothetical protein
MTTHFPDPEAKAARSLGTLADLFGEPSPGHEVLPAPLYWPDISPSDLADEWIALRGWVDGFLTRFPIPTRHVPHCWYRHNELVEALSALRDHERSSYASTAPGTSAVDFHRACRDIEARIVAWAANSSCDSTHQPQPQTRRQPTALDEDEFYKFVADDERHRQIPPSIGAGNDDD